MVRFAALNHKAVVNNSKLIIRYDAACKFVHIASARKKVVQLTACLIHGALYLRSARKTAVWPAAYLLKLVHGKQKSSLLSIP